MGDFDYDRHLAFNRYTNLDGAEWRIVSALVNSQDKHANNLWKMLAYNTEDCLFQPDIPREERLKMIYRDNGLAEGKKIFISPYVDDAWTEEASRIDIFVAAVNPTNHISSQILVGVEIMVHNKIINILGEADPNFEETNPSEISDDSEILVPLKRRATTLLKTILAELNGRFIDGIGQLQLNQKMNINSSVKPRVWNNRAYVGFEVVFCTLMSGVSNDPAYGY